MKPLKICTHEGCSRAPSVGDLCPVHVPREPRRGSEPHPISMLALRDEEVDAHREVNCSNYEDCLDRAAREDWPGWSCIECPVRGEHTAVRELPVRQSMLAPYIETQGTSRPPISADLLLHLLGQGRTREDLESAYAVRGMRRTVGRLAERGMLDPETWRLTGQGLCGACGELKPQVQFQSADYLLSSSCQACRAAGNLAYKAKAAQK